MASHQDVRPEDEALGLALRMRSAWNGVRMPWPTRYSARAGGSARGLPLEELADDLVELAAVDQAAAAKVPDEPFAGAQVGSYHGNRSFGCGIGGRPAARPCGTGTGDPSNWGECADYTGPAG